MNNLASKIKDAKLRKLPVMLALVAALVAPMAIRAYAEEAPVQDPPVEQQQPEQPVEEQPEVPQEPEVIPEVVEPETQEPPVTPQDTEPVEPTQEPDNTETDEDVTEGPVEVLARYQAFAEAEHPGVAIVEVKFVWKHGVKSAKFIFEDGWKVYIGVSDGTTVKVADNRNKVKKCQRRVSHRRAFNRWYLQHSSYYDWWKEMKQNQNNDEQEEGEEQPAEQQGAQVQGASTESNSSRKQNKSKNSEQQNSRKSRSWNRR